MLHSKYGKSSAPQSVSLRKLETFADLCGILDREREDEDEDEDEEGV